MKGNLTMKRIVLLIVIVLLAAIVIKGPDSLIGLAKMSRSASDNGGSLPNVIGKATGVTGKKVLVAYFSWGGNTREVAKLIHSKTGGDLFEIKKETPYPKEYKPTTDVGKQEVEQDARPKLAGPLPDLKQYDVIVLGYPIWWYIEPMPVKTFVEAQDLSGKTILPFATSGGSGIEGSVADLRKTLPKSQVKDGLLANMTGGIDRWLKENGHAWTMPFIKYALQNEVYVGDVMLQKYFTESPVSKKLVKNTGQLQRYYISNNHEPIIDRETFDKVQAKIKANFEFNPSAHWIVKPYCFTSKIVCGKCGNHFYKGLTKTNMVDGLCEHYVCLGKHKKGLKFCNARGIRGNRLRAACCDVLGIDEFDENLFSKQIEKIVTTDTDVLEFYFYDGRMKTAKIHYFSQEEKKHTDPHTKVFGYAWSSNGYQMITNECEAVKLMYQYYSEGAAIIEISRRLEAQGFKARTAISRKLITRVLDSDFYIGHRTIKGQFTESGEDEFIENDHEPLIDLELNRKVKERRREELKKFFNSRKKSAE